LISTVTYKTPNFSLREGFRPSDGTARAQKNEELDMRESRLSTDAGRQLFSAYEKHFTTNEIDRAFTLYEEIIAAHPDTQETGHSKAQAENIVNAEVSKKEIMDSPMEEFRHGRNDRNYCSNISP
jgi:hypothetical protein